MNKTSPDSLQMLSAAEVSALLQIHTGTLKNWRMAGTGPRWFKLGEGKKTHVRYLRSDIETWLTKHSR